MSNLGEILRKARFEKGMTLADVEESTKIRKVYLEAIEQGNYKILPGDFYVRAFIKSYAEAVGLDPAEILANHKDEIPNTYEPQQMESVPLRRSLAFPSYRIGKWVSRLLMWSFPLLILVLIYIFVLQTSQDNSIPEDVSPITDEQLDSSKTGNMSPQLPPQQEDPTDSPPVLPKVSVVHVKTEGNTYWYDVTSSIGLTVELRLTGDECWVQINKSNSRGEMIEQTTLNADNTLKKWVVNDSVWLNIGRANAVELKINGVVVDTGDEPNPRKFQFQLKKS